MTTKSKASLFVWGAVLANNVHDDDLAVNDWWTNEHLAERLRLPGFNRARRYYSSSRKDDGSHHSTKYLALYDVTSIHDLASPEYMHALNNPTAYTEKCLPLLANLDRSACWKVFEMGFRPSSAHVSGNWLMLWSFEVTSPTLVSEKSFRDALAHCPTGGDRGLCTLTCLYEDNYATSIGSDSKSYKSSTLGSCGEDRPKGHRYILLLDLALPRGVNELLIRNMAAWDPVDSVLKSARAENISSQAFQFLCSAESK